MKRLVLGGVALVALAFVCGSTYEAWSRWRVARTVQPNGTIFEVDGRRAHLYCAGEGSPTVVLEAGFDLGGSLSWSTVQPKMARTTRVCSYDRAGIMWSEGGKARSAARIADELHALLAAASEPPPYVMVGHSLGGPLVRVFASQFSGEVVGFVFVDSSHPEQMERIPPEIVEAGALPPALLVRAAAATGLLRLLAPAPEGPLSEEDREAMRRLMPQSVGGALGEMTAMEEIVGESLTTGPFGDLPLVVLTAGRLPEPLPPGIDEAIADQMLEVWLELQTEIAALSTNADQRIIEDASHYIHWDNPEAVVAAVHDVVTAVRETAPVRRLDR